MKAKHWLGTLLAGFLGLGGIAQAFTVPALSDAYVFKPDKAITPNDKWGGGLHGEEDKLIYIYNMYTPLFQFDVKELFALIKYRMHKLGWNPDELEIEEKLSFPVPEIFHTTMFNFYVKRVIKPGRFYLGMTISSKPWDEKTINSTNLPKITDGYSVSHDSVFGYLTNPYDPSKIGKKDILPLKITKPGFYSVDVSTLLDATISPHVQEHKILGLIFLDENNNSGINPTLEEAGAFIIASKESGGNAPHLSIMMNLANIEEADLKEVETDLESLQGTVSLMDGDISTLEDETEKVKKQLMRKENADGDALHALDKRMDVAEKIVLAVKDDTADALDALQARVSKEFRGVMTKEAGISMPKLQLEWIKFENHFKNYFDSKLNALQWQIENLNSYVLHVIEDTYIEIGGGNEYKNFGALPSLNIKQGKFYTFIKFDLRSLKGLDTKFIDSAKLRIFVKNVELAGTTRLMSYLIYPNPDWEEDELTMNPGIGSVMQMGSKTYLTIPQKTTAPTFFYIDVKSHLKTALGNNWDNFTLSLRSMDNQGLVQISSKEREPDISLKSLLRDGPSVTKLPLSLIINKGPQINVLIRPSVERS